MYGPFSLFSMGPHLGHFCAFWVRFKFVFFLISNFVFFGLIYGCFYPFMTLGDILKLGFRFNNFIGTYLSRLLTLGLD